MALMVNTPTSGIEVVMGVNDDIIEIICSIIRHRK